MGQGYRPKGKVLAQSRRKLPCRSTNRTLAGYGRDRFTHARKIKSSFHSTSISQNLVRGLWGKGNRIMAGYLAEEKGK